MRSMIAVYRVSLLKRASALVRAAVGRTVLSHALGTRYTGVEDQLYLMGFRALSVWLPVSPKDYDNRFADFQTSAFYHAVPSWGRWISRIYKPN